MILAIPAAIAAIVGKRIYLVGIVVLLLAWVAVSDSRFTYQMSFSIFHIKERIKQGEWSAIFFCLNSMKQCTTLGPVFIVRDIKTFGLINYASFLPYWDKKAAGRAR